MRFSCRIISLLLFLCIVTSFICPISEASSQDGIHYDFRNKTLEDVESFVYHESNSATPSTLLITNNGLTVTKDFSGSNYGIDSMAEVRFIRQIEEYSEDTRTESYQESFKGKYKLSFPIKISGDRLTIAYPVFENSTGEVLPVLVRTAYKELYVEGGPTLIGTMNQYFSHTLNFEFDTTDNNSFYVYADDNEPNLVSSTAMSSSTAIKGFRFGLYNYGGVGDMSVPEYTLIPVMPSEEEALLEEVVKSFSMSEICEFPENVTTDLVLPTEYEGCTISWSSDKPDVISQRGKVTIPDDRQEEVCLKAVFSDGFYELTKCFYLTVPRNPNVLPKLEKATDLKWMGTELSWVAPDEADEYNVCIFYNNREIRKISSSTTNVDLAQYMDKSGFYSASVVAKADGWRDSELSDMSTTYEYINDGDILLHDEDFEGKRLKNFQGRYFHDLTEDDPSTVSITSGCLMLKKTKKGSGYGLNAVIYYYFKNVMEEYNEDTRSEMLKEKYKGKFRIEVGLKTNKQTYGLMAFYDSDYYYEVGNGAISLGGVGDLKVYGDYSKSYKLTTYLDTSDPLSVITSIDGGTPLCAKAGNFGENYTLDSLYYGLKSLSAGGDMIGIDYVRIYRIEDDETDEEVLSATRRLDVSMLTNSPANLTSDLSLPKTIDGCDVKWTSDNIEYISNSGRLMKRSLEKDVDVWMTGVVSKGGHEYIKRFKITVPKEDDSQIILKSAMEELKYTDLTSNNPSNLNSSLTLPSKWLYGTTVTWMSSDPDYIGHDGTLIKSDANSKKSISMTATFTHGDVTATKKYSFMLAVPFGSDYTFFEIQNPDSEKATKDGDMLYIYPSYGGRRFDIDCQFLAELTIDTSNVIETKSEYRFTDNNGNTALGVAVEETDEFDGFEKMYTITGLNSKGEEVIEKYPISLDEKEITLQFVINCYDSTIEFLSHNGEKSSIKLLPDGFGALSCICVSDDDSVSDVKIKMAASEGLDIILSHGGYLTDIESIDGVVLRDIILPSSPLGDFSVVWTSSDSSIISDSGKLSFDKISQDANVTLTVVAGFDDEADIKLVKEYNLAVRGRDYSNLALLKDTSSNTTSPSGNFASKATDGFFETSWQTLNNEQNPYVLIDLGNETAFNTIVLKEGLISDDYNVKEWVVEYSNDNKNWTKIIGGTSIGGDAQTYEFDAVSARYVRWTAVQTNGGNTSLSEFQIYSELSDSEKALQDLNLLKSKLGSLKGLTKSINLPSKGSLWGSELSYYSDNKSALSDDGNVKRSGEIQKGTLKVVAHLNGQSEELEIPFSVNAKVESSSGGGSSFGGTIGGAGSVYVPNSNVITDPIQTDYAFEDVPSSHWAYDYIMKLKNDGVANGNGKGYFNPDNIITREEFLKMLIEALGITGEFYEADFEDVSKDAWYSIYVSKGVWSGVIKGLSETVFGIGSPITRQDMAVMCSRALKYKGQLQATGSISEFVDFDDVAVYAKESVSGMYALNIITGYPDNTFKPHNNATRAEAAKIIVCLKQLCDRR